MTNTAKLVSLDANNIFLQNTFSLVLQFPFEDPIAVENFKQLLTQRGLALRKVSKSALSRQLTQTGASFIPTFGANFVLTHENPEQVLLTSQWTELRSLLQQHQAHILFCRNTVDKGKMVLWYDSNRLLEHSTLLEQPPFSNQLFQILRNKTVLPLLINSVVPLLRLLTHKEQS